MGSTDRMAAFIEEVNKELRMDRPVKVIYTIEETDFRVVVIKEEKSFSEIEKETKLELAMEYVKRKREEIGRELNKSEILLLCTTYGLL